MSLSENERHSQNNVAINDQSQGSVPIHLRCGAIFNSLLLQIFTESTSEKKHFLNRWRFGKIVRKKLDCMLMITRKAVSSDIVYRVVCIINHSEGCAVRTQ